MNGQPVEVGEIASRIATEVPGDEAVLIFIEIHDDGQGPLNQFLQLQADCCRRGVWERVQVVYRKAESEVQR
jgi:hypothetical protein